MFKISFFLRLFNTLDIGKMVHIVVQWVDENSVSVIRENQVILAAEQELKEGMAIQVQFGKNSKGRLAVFNAVVLKVFGKYNKFHYSCIHL